MLAKIASLMICMLTGHDETACWQRATLRDEADQLIHAEDHISSISVLNDLAVPSCDHSEALRAAHYICCNDLWTDWVESVKAAYEACPPLLLGFCHSRAET